MSSTSNVGMADTLKTSLMRRSVRPFEFLASILGADFPLGSSHLLVTTRFAQASARSPEVKLAVGEPTSPAKDPGRSRRHVANVREGHSRHVDGVPVTSVHPPITDMF